MTQSTDENIRLGIALTKTEVEMLEKITARRFPGRTRMQSVTVAELIREEFIRQMQQKPEEDD